MLSHLTLEEKINLMCQYQEEIPRLGIKKYKHGTEGAHGVAWLGKATVFPQNIGLGCTWNEELMKEIGRVIADEARIYYQKDPEKNGLTIWAPTVDMERDPRWGRTEEAYGEDPYLTGKLTTELIKGMQGDHPFYLKTAATLKHFLGNNNEIDRGECSVSIDPRNMREYYLKAFEMQIKEGKAQSIMTAYNAVNGKPCNMNPDVMNILKKEWGMDGFVVSDAGDVLGTVNDHMYVDSYAEAVALSIKNGIDSITDDQEISLRAIRDALEQGLISEEDLDRALKNTFRVRFRLGEFDPADQNPYSFVSEEKLCSAEHSELSLQAAKESIVLLKNKNILPLKKKKVAVIGPLANEVYTDWYSGTPPYTVSPLQGLSEKLNGNLVYADGCDRIRLRSAETNEYIQVDSEDILTVGKGKEHSAEKFIHTNWGWGSETLKSITNGIYVTVDDHSRLSASSLEAKGWFVKEVLSMTEEENSQLYLSSWNNQSIGVDQNGVLSVAKEEKDYFVKEIVENGIEKAVEAAKQAETAVIFVGNQPFINGKECIDRPDITLPLEQEKLIQEVLNVNPNTVVVIVGSYPFAINWVDEHVPAVLYSSHGGQEFGRAISDVLFGDYNPAGRLNMTWYRSVDQLPDLMDYDIIKGKRTYQYFDRDPLYPFGHGLSYTTFAYRDLVIKESEQKGDQINISITVTNIGDFDGDEVVQLYVSCENSRVKRPLKTLKGFKRHFIEKGQSKVITFTLNKDDLAFWDVTRGRYCIEAGYYNIMVGSSSDHIHLSGQLYIDGEVIPPRSVTDRVMAIDYDNYQSIYIDECTEGGYSIRNKSAAGWVSFHQIKWEKEIKMLTARVANGGKKALIEIRANSYEGPILCECEVPQTGGFQAWTTVQAPLNAHSTDVKDLYIIFKGDVQLSWFYVS
ncbi:glycoside hydrolase family 3 protein [uncultured Metabacillus sp.]|uniref:glycoside hydrolase family 3 protein n=1 Tax=uncultured Metabacillus sp. TaxID=2860135 RepID=UPI0026093033|nr:glycoside hydrolase family 3 protein [uncultured Metabacillus sp.]